MNDLGTPRPDDVDRLARAWGERPVSFRRVTRGYTPAERWVVKAASGRSCFLKIGTTEDTARCLRDEMRIYGQLRADFVAECHAFVDDPSRPLLALEDLSDAHWPPPWDARRVERVVATIDALSSASLDLPRDLEIVDGWERVAADPEPLLSLRPALRSWLDASLPVLLEATAALDVSPQQPGHYDLRSDNLCFDRDRVVLVDWNCARRGLRDLDLGFWLPSLHFEGGPAPERVLADAPSVAACVSGFFAARAGLPDLPHAPRVRRVQREQLSCALPWAARALDLPPPPGLA